VLSDPGKRQIYDIYGRLGLQAGLEVGTKYKDLDEVKKEWETFQAQQAAQRFEAEAAPQSLVRVEAFAVHTVQDLWRRILPPRAPLVANCTMSSNVDFKLADSHTSSIGGTPLHQCSHHAMACQHCAGSRCSRMKILLQAIRLR
jgi:DnaJ family protein C protein 11